MIEFIGFFFVGAISTYGLITLQRKYIKWNALRHERKRERIRAEENGWIKTSMTFAYWSSRTRMNKWHREIKEETELCVWLKENTTGDFKTDWIDGHRYIRFNDDKDGMAFKLRWS